MPDLLKDELVKRAIAAELNKPEPLKPPEEEKPTPKSGLLALLAGGAADIGSTIYGLRSGKMQENNPLIRGMNPKVGIPVGAALETGGYLLARKLLGKNHPTLLNNIGLGMGATHGALAIKNLMGTHDATKPPQDGLIWHKDGYWYDPSAFR